MTKNNKIREEIEELLLDFGEEFQLGLSNFNLNKWVDRIMDLVSQKEEEVREEVMTLKGLKEIMETLNNWHSTRCDFPSVDQAVCTCDRKRKSLLSSLRDYAKTLCEEVIGEEDSRGTMVVEGEKWDVVADPFIDGRNQLRAEQRKQLKELLEKQ